MNPLTGGPHYMEVGLRHPRVSSSAKRVKDDIRSVVFSNHSCDFDTNFVEEERVRRQAEFKKKQDFYMKRREAKVLKEAGRWQAVEENYKKSLDNLEIKRSKWRAGQKNKPSEAFNVLTLDYETSKQGEFLKQRDDERKYREALRLFNLDAKMNSGFNIITGASRQPPLPSRYY